MVLAGFVLILVGSALGAGMYAYFYPPATVYLSEAQINPSISKASAKPVPNSTLEREQTFQPVPAGSQQQSFPDFAVAANRARDAVVHIRSSFAPRKNREGRQFFSNPFRDRFEEGNSPHGFATGSGVMISSDGYIATNNHVIADAETIEVTLFDNRSYEARVLGTDITTDLALLKIEAGDLPSLQFGDSDAVEVGQWVLAVGNPMDLNSTVTAGIVSAKGRNINLLRADSQFAIESFIQTDAAVNKGNSGGALVNMQGDLIGINTAIASRTGYYAGYSFAIPASIARKVMEDLLDFGSVQRGFLGVSIQPVNAELAIDKDLKVLKGAYVSNVYADLGAWEAGITTGDVIVSVNGLPVNSSSELQEQVSRYRPGDEIQVILYRGDQRLQIPVQLKRLDTEAPQRLATRPQTLEFRESVFRSLTKDELIRFDIEQGIMVENPGEAMLRGGIQEGFVITEVDGQEIQDLVDLEKALENGGEFVSLKGLYSKGMIATYSFSW